jgi:hypothetical protein
MALDKLLSLLKGNALFLKQASNLSDLNSAATARTNLGVYSKSETDLSRPKLDTDSNVTVANDSVYTTYQMTKTSSSGTSTYTLPSSPTTGLKKKFKLIQQSTGPSDYLIISGNGKNIDGNSVFHLNGNGDYLEIEYNGTQWIINTFQASYATNGDGWINRTSWTGGNPGSNTTLNADSNINHNLNAPISKLKITAYISVTGSESDAKVYTYSGGEDGGSFLGLQFFPVDNNNNLWQTATSGMTEFLSGGGRQTINTENWYYKVVVFRVR